MDWQRSGTGVSKIGLKRQRDREAMYLFWVRVRVCVSALVVIMCICSWMKVRLSAFNQPSLNWLIYKYTPTHSATHWKFRPLVPARTSSHVSGIAVSSGFLSSCYQLVLGGSATTEDGWFTIRFGLNFQNQFKYRVGRRRVELCGVIQEWRHRSTRYIRFTVSVC